MHPNITSENPIFIVGAPRSGTTLLRSILDSHPSICCPIWETGFFVRFHSIVDGDVKELIRDNPDFPLTREGLMDWGRQSFCDLMNRLTAKSHKPRRGEKTPAHVLHIGMIHEMFPKAQFVHIIRAGTDVVRSLRNKSWAPRNTKHCISLWVDSIRSGREQAKNLPAGAYLEIRYESLTTQPEKTIQDLCQFLGEDFDSKMLDFHKPENNSWGIAKAPIQSSPLHNYRKLNLLESWLFRSRASALMRELGYP